MANHELIYKIEDTNTGLFSSGGVDPRWSKRGKTWNRRAQALASLRMYQRGIYGQIREIPATWTIVEYKLVTQKRQRAREAMGEKNGP
jgi:hypothetical protein